MTLHTTIKWIKRLLKATLALKLANELRALWLRQLYLKTALFDPGFYLKRYPDVQQEGVDPFIHYFERGASEGRQPHPLFDPAYYLEHLPAEEQKPKNPLVHYRTRGGSQHFNPHLLFDSEYYLTHCPAAAASKLTPLSHYLTYGAAAGKDPHPLFDSSYYLESFEDVRQSGFNPLVHYVLYGALEGRFPNPKKEVPYLFWRKLFDTPSEAELHALSRRAESWNNAPQFTLLLLAQGLTVQELKESIETVCRQTYPYWQLFILPGPKEDRVSAEILQDRAAKVQLMPREELGLWLLQQCAAIGEESKCYFGVLNQGAQLRSHALSVLAGKLEEKPVTNLLYADHDFLNDQGEVLNPHFKGDWDPFLFYGSNYIGDFFVFREKLLKSLLHPEELLADGDCYELLLQLSKELAPDSIEHLPAIIFHCCTSLSDEEAERRVEREYAELQALTTHFRVTNCYASVLPFGAGMRQVSFLAPMEKPLLSIIIPTRDRVQLLRSCVQSILQRSSYKNYELLIVDNQSVETESKCYLEELAQKPNIRVLKYSQPYNYAALNNWAVREAKGEVLGFLNNDIEVITETWLEKMLGCLYQPAVGIVGAKLYYPDGRVQHAGITLGKYGLAGHAWRFWPAAEVGYFGRGLLTQEVSAVTAACALIKRDLFEELGGFDEVNLPIAFNDVDLCLRLRAQGYKVLLVANAELYHHESASLGLPDSPERTEQFKKETCYFLDIWRKDIGNDSFYSPNLYLGDPDYILDSKPRSYGLWRGQVRA